MRNKLQENRTGDVGMRIPCWIFAALVFNHAMLEYVISFSTCAQMNARQRSVIVAMRRQQTLTQLSSSSTVMDAGEVGTFLAGSYPTFNMILKSNDEIWKALGDSKEGFTLFVPTEEAMRELGEKKMQQILDPRNKETIDKIGMYHAVPEAVTADQLFSSGGIITLGGEVPVGRSTKGGFFGFGGQEDGGILIQSAKVLQTFEVSNGLIHEVNDLISPQLLWRYMDQLRIPGSR